VQRISIEDVGIATAFLAREGACSITGETPRIEAGYRIIHSPQVRWAQRS
jgi:enoyl-[acyl-carrier-protein] reductase (NADH)